MNKGVFSDEFTDVFGDILADVFSDGFPAASGNAPDPDPQGSARGPGGASGGSVPIDLSAPDSFDFDLPSEARVPFETDGEGAVATDFGQLLMGKPGGDGGGGGKPDKGDGGGGGGGGKPDKGDGGSQTASEIYVSGAEDLVTNTDNFNISVEFYGDYSSGTKLALAGYVKAAAEFLSSLIDVGLPDDPNMFRSFDTTKFEVDDLHLEIYVDKFKGPGAATIAAGTDVYAANDWDGNWPGGFTPLEPYTETPAGATITFNQSYIDTLEGNGTLDDVVLHEMMHALYFGLWETAENNLIDDAGVYQGTQGKTEYSGDLVIEDEGLAGSVGAHWAEAVFDKELMTSVVETTDDMYLSYFSVATLADLQIIDATDAAAGDYDTRGYTLDANWKTLVDGLNGTTDTGTGIDLDNWWTDNGFV